MPTLAQKVAVLFGGFTPPQLPNLALWLDAGLGLTLSTAGYSGTGTITKSGNDVTGSSTLFTTEVKVGDTLSATGITGTVTAITSATALTMDTSETQAAGQAYTINPTTSVSARVTTAADQSGSGNNVTQATASAKPSYRPTGGPSSRPSIQFDSINDQLTNATFWDTFPAAVTVYAVLVPRGSLGTDRFIVCKSNVDTQDRFFLSIDGATDKIRLFTEGGNAGNKTAFSTATLSADSAYLVTAQYLPGAALQVWLNGVAGPAGGTADAIGAGTHTDFIVGNGTTTEGLDSDLSVLLIYSAAHDAGQRAQVWGYLQGRFGNF